MWQPVPTPKSRLAGHLTTPVHLAPLLLLRACRGIEGAIGSIHKVDASYLSPHVNIASRMCAAAKQYGKSILMSSVFYNLLSPTAARYCRLVRARTRVAAMHTRHRGPVGSPRRPVLHLNPLCACVVRASQVDVIQVKGSKVALPVYTYDVWEWRTKEPSSLMNFESFVQYCTDADVFNTNQHFIPGEERRISVLGMAPIIEHPIVEAQYSETLFETDADLRAVRRWFSADFRRKFSEVRPPPPMSSCGGRLRRCAPRAGRSRVRTSSAAGRGRVPTRRLGDGSHAAGEDLDGPDVAHA